MKKLLLFIALTIFGLGLNAQNVGDETTIDYDGYSLKFKITSVEPAKCKVSDCTGSPTDVIIPSAVTISGTEFNVTSIGYQAFWAHYSLTSVEIPSNVTSIEGSAFSSCTSLTSIEIPSSVTSIGDQAFWCCYGLTSIEIPSSVTSIEGSAFSNCSNLTSISVEEGNTVYDSRENCNAIIKTSSNTLVLGCPNTIIPNSVTSIGASAFYYCKNLTSIEIPNSVTSIGTYAFYECEKLTSVTFEENSQLYTIESSAFYSCWNLTSIEIPNSVTYIGESAFAGCPSLTSIEIPSSVTFIANHAIYRCSSLTSISVEEGNSVYDSRENCNAIIKTANNTLIVSCQNTIIPNSVTSIGSEAFLSCSGLTNIEIPNSVTSIGYRAFASCSDLKSIRCLSDSVPELGMNVFEKCPSNMQIQVPEKSIELYKAADQWNKFNIIKIYPYHYGDYVIKEYDGYSLKFTVNPLTESCEVVCEVKPETITAITIPSTIEVSGSMVTVTSIGDNAFKDCSSMTSIEIPSSVTSIGDNAFAHCSSMTNVTFGENSQLTSIERNTFIDCSSLTNIEIPSSVTSIGSCAFEDCSSLTNIEIPYAVTSINASAFENCSALKSVTFEENSQLSTIGSSAFKNCSKLTSIEIPSSVTTIGDIGFSYYTYGTFYNCSSLTSVTFGENSQLTHIGNGVFSDCDNITNIEIPSSVTYISESALSSSKLKVVICHAENVPETKDRIFSEYVHLTIYVPETSVDAYKAADTWNKHDIRPIGGSDYPSFINYDNYSLKFVIINSETKECSVSCFRRPNVETELTIPSTATINKSEYTVTAIADSAFLECDKFVGDLVIPNTVKSVGVRAFRDCVGFNGSLVLSENLETIKNLAFAGGNDVIVNYTGTLNIPANVTSIGINAFRNCSHLTGIVVEDGNSVYDSRDNSNNIIETSTNKLILGCQNSVIPDNITSIGDDAFLNSGLKGKLNIPDGVTYIGINAFRFCSDLTGDLVIPNSVTYVGKSAFWECTGFDGTLTLSENMDTIYDYSFASYDSVMGFKDKLVIPSKVKYIGNVAFQNCSELTEVQFADIDNSQLTYIGDWAFTLCKNMTNAEIPSSVKHIGKYALNCPNMEKIVCYAQVVPETDETAFKECPSNMKIYVPEKSLNSYKSKQPWKDFLLRPLGESINELLSSSINIYPNPVENELFIATEMNVKEVAIYDVYGRICCRDASNASTSNSMDTFNVSVQKLEAGVYFVKVVTNEGEIVKRFVKK